MLKNSGGRGTQNKRWAGAHKYGYWYTGRGMDRVTQDRVGFGYI